MTELDATLTHPRVSNGDPARSSSADAESLLGGSDRLRQLIRGESRTPHDLLGIHPITHTGETGAVVRARVPRAAHMWVAVNGQRYEMECLHDALFVRVFPGETPSMRYQLVVAFVDGTELTFEDPYRFLPTLGDVDLHLFGEGRHLRLWEQLGAQHRVIDGVEGTSFAVWAPNAKRVSVIGSFNGWDGRAHPMRVMGNSGVFELFVPDVPAGALYKFEIRAPNDSIRVKTDPFAFRMEQAPGHASVVERRGAYTWGDGDWMSSRAMANPLQRPMIAYEVHLASWRRAEDGRMLTYRELAPQLVEHLLYLGCTHVELMPVLEHPYGGSWGYQVGGYYAPTSRHGTPDDFRFFVDTLHQAGIGVLLDWVPAHFPKDDWALRRFDGTACYEHADSRLGDHPEWGTHIFNYARHEVRNFLLSNALYWIEEFHLDGLRVDAVASMLYLDYGREDGQWMRNRFGGRENLEAVAFLKQLNASVQSQHPGVAMIAEESTTWPRVTHPIREGGLGFTFKWNMGWMHDTLDYFKVDPFFRKGAHDKLTFAMMYEYSEKFINPLSHDEVVHMKGSLLRKMPGDEWQRLANLRALVGYSITRPGKSLFFMGTELGPWSEWNHDRSLEWDLLEDPRRRGLMAFFAAAGALYQSMPCFWRLDHEPAGFAWIGVSDKEQSVLSYARMNGKEHVIVILNLTPVPREQYRLGAPTSGRYRVVLNSDHAEYGGSGYEMSDGVETEEHPYHGFEQSVCVTLPPLSILVLCPDPMPTNADVIETAHVSLPEYESLPVYESLPPEHVSVPLELERLSVADESPTSAPAAAPAAAPAKPQVPSGARSGGVRQAGVVKSDGLSTVEQAKARAKVRALAKAQAREETKAQPKAGSKSQAKSATPAKSAKAAKATDATKATKAAKAAKGAKATKATKATKASKEATEAIEAIEAIEATTTPRARAKRNPPE